MPTAAECVEQIDTQVYRLLYLPPGPGGAPGSSTAGSRPAAPGEPPAASAVEWEAGAPEGDYHPPGHVARALYHWLLPSSGCGPSIDPATAVTRLRGAYPSEAEVLAIVGFATAAARVAPELDTRAEHIRRAFGVSREFVTRLWAAVDEFTKAAATRGQEVSARRYLSDPPKPLFDVIVAAAAAAARRRTPLTGLSAPAYQHPADQAFQTQLAGIPVISRLVEWFASYSGRAGRLSVQGRGFEVTEGAVPVVYKAFRAAADALGLAELPPLFMSNQGFTPGVGGVVSAETFGVDEPYISISQGAAGALDPAELTFLLGRELGHIQARHVSFRGLARWLAKGVDTAAVITAGLVSPLTDATVRPVLAAYFRATALTADRAGLLAVQSREAALRVMCKQSGFPFRDAANLKTRAIIEQAVRRRARLGESLVSRLFDVGSQYAIEEPMVVDRVAALLDWMDDGGYPEVLQATPGQLKAMAARRDADSKMQALTDTAVRALTDWAVERFAQPKPVVGPAVRRMVYEQVRPDTSIAPVLRLELVVTRRGVNDLTYELAALFADQGKAIIATMALDVPPGWDAAPHGIRQDVIRHGGKTHVRLLFPIPG